MIKSVFSFDDVPFERRLAETISWCASRACADDPKHSLRSEALRPSILERDRASAVRTVTQFREGRTRDVDGVSLREGRLLVYFPDADLSDGAAEVASRGFFDVNNVPPWDTWVALADDGPQADVSYRQYVVAWVPPALIECVHVGIDVNPEACIVWLEDASVRARDELQRLTGS